MATYELLRGTHVESGRVGQDQHIDPDKTKTHRKQPNTADRVFVESDRKLDEIFVNKFRKVGDGEIIDRADPERKATVASMIEAGEWEEKDRAFLENLPDDRFRKVASLSEGPRPVRPNDDSQTLLEDKDRQQEKSKAKPQSPLGEDVTAMFPAADKAGLKVFKNAAGKHQVTTAKAPTKPVNPKPLEAQEVDKFTSDYQKEK